MMIGADGNQTCPRCYHVMIQLSRFNANDDPLSPDDGSGHGWNIPWELGLLSELWNQGFGRMSAWFRQRRLSKVLRRHPRAMYCSGCGFIRKK
jgi:hypothetical protein